MASRWRSACWGPSRSEETAVQTNAAPTSERALRCMLHNGICDRVGNTSWRADVAIVQPSSSGA